MRVLISTSTSFRISRKAVQRARELDAQWAFPDHVPLVDEPQHYSFGEGGRDLDESYNLPGEVPRHDPQLLQVFEELGGVEMSGWDDDEILCLEIPDDVAYYITSYCGEWVAEQHRVWDRSTGNEGEPAGTPSFTFTKNSVFQLSEA